jgi:hypothetical protein
MGRIMLKRVYQKVERRPAAGKRGPEEVEASPGLGNCDMSILIPRF